MDSWMGHPLLIKLECLFNLLLDRTSIVDETWIHLQLTLWWDVHCWWGFNVSLMDSWMQRPLLMKLEGLFNLFSWIYYSDNFNFSINCCCCFLSRFPVKFLLLKVKNHHKECIWQEHKTCSVQLTVTCTSTCYSRKRDIENLQTELYSFYHKEKYIE